jgi:hypothetical protein
MNIFKIIQNLYTNKKSNWIDEIEEDEIQPLIIQRWLSCDEKLAIVVRWCDKYVFSLPPKMYLSLVWSVIPKRTNTPFLKYISKNKDEEELDFILKLVRKHLKLSDNDYYHYKPYIISNIKKNMVDWFKFYGIEKHHWKDYFLDFDLIKKEDVIKSVGLNAYGF